MDYYQILGIPRDATHEDIVKAYRQAALKHHPDKNLDNPDEAAQQFKKCAEAFETLSDKGKKHQYDSKHRTTKFKRPSRKRPKGTDFFNDPNLGNIKTPKAPLYDIWGNKMTPRQRAEWEKNAATEGMSDEDLNDLHRKQKEAMEKALKPKVHNPNPPPPPPPRNPKDGFLDAFANEYLDGNSPYLR
jgi:curved DNA-binding protein CbpA